jgi:hypothetical protein
VFNPARLGAAPIRLIMDSNKHWRNIHRSSMRGIGERQRKSALPQFENRTHVMDTITGRIYSRILEAPHMKDFFSGAHYNFLLYRDRWNVPLTASTSATNI